MTLLQTAPVCVPLPWVRRTKLTGHTLHVYELLSSGCITILPARCFPSLTEKLHLQLRNLRSLVT